MLTVTNWDKYQGIPDEVQPAEQQTEQPADNQPTTNKEPADNHNRRRESGNHHHQGTKDQKQVSTGVQESGRSGTAESKNPFSQKSDDDEKPKTYSNPEEELKAIYLAKAGAPVTVAVFMGIRETLELKNVSMAEFVAEIRKHTGNHWRNPAGFLRGKANKFRSETTPAPAITTQVQQDDYKCKDCFSQKRGEGLLFVDGKTVPCRCATPEYIERMLARGVLERETAA